MPVKRRRRTADYINVRLSPKDDPDLIEWWGNQPDKAGAAAVKAAIRHHRDSASDTTPATRSELVQGFNFLAAQLDEYKRSMEQLTRVVAGLHQRIETGGIVTTTAPANGSVDEQRLTEAEQAQRLSKIKGNKW